MRLHRNRSFLSLLMCLTSALSAASAGGFRPVPSFSPGEVVRYRMNLTILIESSVGPEDDPAASERSLRGAVDLTWRVEAVAQESDGSTRLRAVIEALGLEPPEWAGQLRPADIVGQIVSYRLDPDGRVDDIQLPASWSQDGNAPSWLGAWLDLSPGGQSGLPADPLKPGDRWTSTRSRETPGLPRQQETSESEYLRDEVRGGVPCASLLTRYTTYGADAQEEVGRDGGRMRTERLLEGEGDLLVCHDLANGRVVESTLRSRELLRLRVHDISHDRRQPGPALVLETRTQRESYLRVVD